MPSRQPPLHKDSDAAGRARYSDFDASRDRVRQKLAAAHPVTSNTRTLSLRRICVAASLLLCCFMGWYFLQQPAYAQLADDYRVRIATDELSTTRAINRPAEALPVATALSFYHQAKYNQAAAAFSTLAQQSVEPKRDLFVFYQGTSEWLEGNPVAAIKTLKPLQQNMSSANLRYRTVCYVLAMAYVDQEEFSKAVPLFNELAKKDDGMGQRAAEMLKVLPRADF